MGASTLDQPIEEKTRTPRRDPKPRRLDGMYGAYGLKRTNPSRVYKWVNTLATEFGVDYYKDIGYEAELYDPQGVQVCGGSSARSKGEQMIRQGQLLMSTSIENAARIKKEGVDGEHGQDLADRMEAMIVSQRAADENTAGLGRMYVRAKNETTPLVEE